MPPLSDRGFRAGAYFVSGGEAKTNFNLFLLVFFSFFFVILYQGGFSLHGGFMR